MKNDNNPQQSKSDLKDLSSNTKKSQTFGSDDPAKSDYQQGLGSQSRTSTSSTFSDDENTSPKDSSEVFGSFSDQTSPANIPNFADNTDSNQDTSSDVLISPTGTDKDSPQAVVSSPHAPEKYGGKKIIATIFGILILVGAVATGVVLVQRQQQLQQQATSTENGWVSLPSTENKCGLPAGEYTIEGKYYAPSGGHLTTEYRNVSGDNAPHYEGKDVGPGSGSIQISGYWPGYGDILFGLALTEPSGQISAESINWYCWDSPTQTPTPTQTSTPTPTTTMTTTQTPTPTQTSTPTPTLPQTATAECFSVIAYDSNWNQLSTGDLSSLEAGDTVLFAVSGQTSSGSFTKARFSVNDSLIGEITSKKPSTDEFYIEYDIPSGVSNFTVKGEIFHSVLGWI